MRFWPFWINYNQILFSIVFCLCHFSIYDPHFWKKWLCPQSKFMKEKFLESRSSLWNTFLTILDQFWWFFCLFHLFDLWPLVLTKRPCPLRKNIIEKYFRNLEFSLKYVLDRSESIRSKNNSKKISFWFLANFWLFLAPKIDVLYFGGIFNSFTHFIRIVLRSFCCIARFHTSIELFMFTKFFEKNIVPTIQYFISRTEHTWRVCSYFSD